MDRTLYWLWLTTKSTISRSKIKRLLSDLGDIDHIYCANPNDFLTLDYLTDADMLLLCDKDIGAAQKLFDILKSHNVKIVTIDMDEYPILLRYIDDPPLLLYCRGKFINLNNYLCISVVGTRQCTKYGESTATNLCYDMAKQGAVIISGMALGIDTAAHTGALNAKMPTVAVLGCGINTVYPKQNAALMKEIMKTGMVISEYPLNSEPLRHHFPQRNRIISGLSKAIVIVEADIKSGSLITASYAQDFNRDIFAVPGNINSIVSKGTNYLLKDGAAVTTCADDVISHYTGDYNDLLLNGQNLRKISDEVQFNIPYSNSIKPKQDNLKKEITDIKERILFHMTDEPMHIDEISQKSKIDIKTLNANMLILEVSGKVCAYPGNRYSLISD